MVQGKQTRIRFGVLLRDSLHEDLRPYILFASLYRDKTGLAKKQKEHLTFEFGSEHIPRSLLRGKRANIE
jgi:hypothetical protein